MIREQLAFVIPDGATSSNVLRLPEEMCLAGLIIPAITTSTAITFEVGFEENNLSPLQDAGSNYSITIDNTKQTSVALDPNQFYPWKFVKLVVANAQTGDKAIKGIVREY